MTTPTLSDWQAQRQRRQALIGYGLIAAPTLLVIGLFFFPALQSFIRTLSDVESANGGLSLQRYIDFVSNPIAISNLKFTLLITIATNLGLFIICIPLALYLRFSRSRIAGWVQTIAMFPLFVPGIMSAYALIRFLRPRGMFETFLNIFGAADGYETPYLKPLGIIIGLVWESIPFTLLIITAGLQQIDDALIDSARDVGANNWQILTRIMFPLAQRSLLIAFCLNFIGNFGAYTIPYLLGPAAPQTLGVYMQQTLQDFELPREAETQAMVMFSFSLIVGLIYVRTVIRSRTERS